MESKNFLKNFVLFVLSVGVVSSKDWTPNPKCPYPSDIITYDYVPNNCTAYYECDHGNLYLFNCPVNLEWNHVHNYCDYPENVDCSRRAVTTTPVNTGTTQAWTPNPKCPYPSEIITYDYVPGNCTAYYECDHGNLYLFNCPVNLEWNHVHNYCDYPENVDCSRSNSTTTTHGPTGSTVKPTADPICGGQPDGTYLPNIHDCTKFYECVGGHAVSFDCPGGLEWNNVSKTCDFPDSANCTPQ